MRLFTVNRPISVVVFPNQDRNYCYFIKLRGLKFECLICTKLRPSTQIQEHHLSPAHTDTQYCVIVLSHSNDSQYWVIVLSHSTDSQYWLTVVMLPISAGWQHTHIKMVGMKCKHISTLWIHVPLLISRTKLRWLFLLNHNLTANIVQCQAFFITPTIGWHCCR